MFKFPSNCKKIAKLFFKKRKKNNNNEYLETENTTSDPIFEKEKKVMDR